MVGVSALVIEELLVDRAVLKRRSTRSSVAIVPNSPVDAALDQKQNQRAGGGAVMAHALINCTNDVDAEAESWLPTLSASALSTPDSGVNSEKHRTRHCRTTRPEHQRITVPGLPAIRPAAARRHRLRLVCGSVAAGVSSLGG